MKGEKHFTRYEADQIISLIKQKLISDSATQKKLRAKIRRLGFYSSDFGLFGGYNVDDFLSVVTIHEKDVGGLERSLSKPSRSFSISKTNDESYIIDLCDEVLGIKASRQHRFDFLKGDAGTKLPVDAYYNSKKLVIEYREKQHTEEVKFFDKKNTISGVSRGEQRRIYDQRRRDTLPQYGIQLIELDYSEFPHSSSKRLLRNKENDIKVIRSRLSN